MSLLSIDVADGKNLKKLLLSRLYDGVGQTLVHTLSFVELFSIQA